MIRKNILNLNSSEARQFFLKHESYCNIDLPKYFSFNKLLEELSKEFNGKELNSLKIRGIMETLDDVNHLIYANKDGKLSWRPLEIIHPLAYVALAHKITEPDNWEKLNNRFRKFQANNKIKCLSIPAVSETQQSDKALQISNWWEQVEQQSIRLSLEYDYIFDTDIADCYGSIYTHSIAWAVEGKKIAKSNRSTNLLGNIIDKSIQNTQHQQTNGIPQGSVLMDFIAEIVLGYIDRILSLTLKRSKISDYQILRYRDDYRIFVNDSSVGEKILKLLSEIMMPFGFKLNASKTKGSQDVITQSIKKDKLAWLAIPQNSRMSLQKQLLLIRQHSISYPNSGSLSTALNKLDEKIENREKKNINDTEQLISIITDIAYNNPKCIPVCCAIISKLLARMTNDTELAQLIYRKLSRMPNSGFAQIWLQRMLKAKVAEFHFPEKMCNLHNMGANLWNNSWISDRRMNNIIENTPIFLQDEFNELDDIILNDEVAIFKDYP